MDSIRLIIDDVEAECRKGDTVLDAARKNGIYIPSLCNYPGFPAFHDLEPQDVVFRGTSVIKGDSKEKYDGCKLCIVQIDGGNEPVKSCEIEAKAGMTVVTGNADILNIRQQRLSEILEKHPHACLLCNQKKGCDRIKCFPNVPEQERCCEELGICELQKVAEFIGIKDDLQGYAFRSFPKFEDEPLYARDYNLCIGCLRCVRACNEMCEIGALGFVRKNGEIVVGTKAPTLADSGCRFCTICVEVCPTGAITDKNIKAENKKNELVPCISACPAGINIPEYLRYVVEGEYDTALAVIRERVPFPNSLGHVCFRPCETECRRVEVNGESIAICNIERFAAAKGDGKWTEKISKRLATGKTVAVIGAGPAGLTSAYFLALKGHSVTVFDEEEDAGGMLRYGIPEYRLPKAVLEEDLKYIWQLGVKFESNKRIVMKDILGKYDAILISSGNQVSRKLRIDGAEMFGVLWGLDFLRSVRKGENMELSGNVLVIGGGTVAVDVALSAKRLGASKVTMVCLEKANEMPAHKWEIDRAIDEGVEVHTSWGPRVVEGVDEVEKGQGSTLAGTGYTLTGKKIERRSSGKVRGVEFMRCVSVYDENKQFSPMYDDCEIQHFDADTVIFAIGQAPDASFINVEGVRTERDLIKVDSDFATEKAGVFACGEATKAPGSVIDAISQGRTAASSIDKYLGGDGDINFELYDKKTPDFKIGRQEGFAKEGRIPMRKLPLARRSDFSLIDLGYGEDAACKEASRCFQCDLRLSLEPAMLPPGGNDDNSDLH